MVDTHADPTDPGTRRPKDGAFKTSGTHFEPLLVPNRMPNVRCDSPCDPFTIFKLFFTDEMLQLIAANTNKNAQLERPRNRYPTRHGGRDLGGSKIRPWVDTNIKELHVYLAIHIYIGLVGLPQYELYWKPGPRLGLHPDVTRSMSLVRFQQISRYLHISDPEVTRGLPAHTKVSVIAFFCIYSSFITVRGIWTSHLNP